MAVFQAGEKVKFLYLEGEGEIVKSLGKGMYLVRNQEGFEIEMSEEELLPLKPPSAESALAKQSLSSSAFSSSSSPKSSSSPFKSAMLSSNDQNAAKQPLDEKIYKVKIVDISSQEDAPKAKASLKEGVYFVLRETAQKDVYQLILLNHTYNSLLFVVGEKRDGQIFLLHHGKLKPKQGVRVSDIRKEDLPYHLLLQGIAVPPSNPFQPLEPFIQHLTINQFTPSQVIPYFPTPVSLHKIKLNLKPLTFSSVTPIHVKEKSAKPTESYLYSDKTLLSSAPPPARLEIDLHIETLRKQDYYLLKKEEILTIQLEAAQKAIDEAILKQIPEIIFIHGIGQSVLKRELHVLLREHPYVQDLDTLIGPPYKGGATLVRLLL